MPQVKVKAEVKKVISQVKVKVEVKKF